MTPKYGIHECLEMSVEPSVSIQRFRGDWYMFIKIEDDEQEDIMIYMKYCPFCGENLDE